MMFRRIAKSNQDITIFFNGQPLQCCASDSVAAALLAHQVHSFRTTPVSGTDRKPYCMIGNCFDCLVVIDGVSDCQSCLIPVRDGMDVRSQNGSGGFGEMA